MRRQPLNQEPKTQRGGRAFTLPEVLAAAAILALAVAAIAQAISAGQKTTYLALDELRAHALAEALIEEALSKPYADPEGETIIGPDTGELSRAAFDNCDDYHGYTEAAGAITDAQGVAYPESYQVYGRTVSITSDTQSVAGFSQDMDGMVIAVTITGPRGQTWQFTRFVAELSDSDGS